ncbi:hypothetical protein ABFS82_14G208800 [Erythranthe guttata]
MSRRFKSSTGSRGAARNRCSDKQFDMRKAKRVKFVDTEMDGLPVFASSSKGRKAAESPTSNAPKTSEYAYFRKFKNGVVHGQSRPLHKENEQLESSEVNHFIREKTSDTGILNHSTKNFNFSVSGERAGPSDDNVFSSPRVSKYDEPDQTRSKEGTNRISKRSLLLSENVTPVAPIPLSPPLYEAPENSDNLCCEKGIFSAKRHRLRQWIAQTSYSDFQKLHPTGSDLVSSLLSRLLPKGDENTVSSKGDAENSCRSITLHESNNMDKGLHFSHKSDKDRPRICSGEANEIIVPERDTFISGFPFPSYSTESPIHASVYMDEGFHFSHKPEKDLPKVYTGKSCEVVLPKRDTFISGFSFPSYCNENHGQDELVDLDQGSMSHVLGNSLAQHDFPSRLPFERYRSSGSFHFRELDEFGSIVEYPREEPQRPLLEWDFERGTDTLDSSVVSHNTAKDVYSGLDTWNVDQRQFPDNAAHAKRLHSSSSFSNYDLEFDALPNYGPTSCLRQNLGPVFDDVKWAISESSRQFFLPLPRTPNLVSMEDMLYNNDVVFYDRDRHWLKNRVLDGKPRNDVSLKYLSAEELAVGDPVSFYTVNKNSLCPLPRQKEAPRDLFHPFSEGAFSSNLHSSLGTRINLPLLLDHDSSYHELYFDDDELEYI